MSREKVELVLHHQRLPANGQGLGSIGILAGGQGPQHHGADHQRRLAVLLRDQARYMALRDVAQLVRQHRGQFVARAHHAQQPQVHAQIALPAAQRR
jgi:hypothetical protein